MKIRLAQHTVDCSGDHVAAQEAWRAQGTGWLPLPGLDWKAEGEAGAGTPGTAWTWNSARLGANLILFHLVEPGPHGAKIHARAELDGPLAWFHTLRLQALFRARLPEALRAVARAVARPPSD
jgi:hypothetical protein